MFITAMTWMLLAGYGGVIFYLVRQTTPQRVTAPEFFEGQSSSGKAPGMWLLVASAAISWIFAKSIDNAATWAMPLASWAASATAFTT
jgi:SSS family solute:Na+ symporter